MLRVFLFLSLVLTCRAESLKVISYNTLYGFNHGKSIELGVNWLKNQQADFIALQEMKGFNEVKFAKIAKEWGHEFTYFYKRPKGMPLAFSSRFAISEVKELHEGVNRGFLVLKSKGVNFIVLHLTSQKISSRLKEAAYIEPQIKKFLDQGDRLMVLGDFNALSSKDAKRLQELDALLLEMRENPKKKYNLSSNGEFDTAVMENFYALGLKDICKEFIEKQSILRGSFPSTILDKIPGHKVQQRYLRRIDYVLTDSKTAARVVKADIPKGGVLEKISDHYPIVVEFEE